MRFSLLRFFRVLAPVALVASCAASAADDTAVGSGIGGFSDEVAASVSSAVAGTGGADASIEITPDSSVPDPTKMYADLCGSGRCAPGGTPDGCAIQTATMTGGSGGAAALTQTCELVPGASGASSICGPVGPSQADDPCKSAADCGVGLGCVQTPNGGACRPYCCGDVEACPAMTYCAPRAMADDGSIEIPVCVPTDNCTLLPDATTCLSPQTTPAPGCCGAGLACFIVRADGSTGCHAPGLGGLNAACPCQPGFVCSRLTDECKKLCHVGNDAVDCPGGGKCEGGSNAFPTGYGVCVAGDQGQY